MSVKAKTGIDLCNNQLLNAVLENKAMSSAPDSPVAGSFFWDTTNNCLKIYNGSDWINYNPLDAFEFSSTSSGVLTVLKKKNSSLSPSVQSIKVIDTNAFEEAGAAAQAYASARSYTDEKVSALLGGAPSEALDTIFELAQAVEDNKDLIESLQSLVTNGVHKAKILCPEQGIVYKAKILCPALTPASGVCTWACNHGLSLAGNDTAVLCDVYTSSGEKVMCDITINSRSNVIIKISSDTTITAGSYYAVVVG